MIFRLKASAMTNMAKNDNGCRIEQLTVTLKERGASSTRIRNRNKQ